jgi:hypothetical protein
LIENALTFAMVVSGGGAHIRQLADPVPGMP